MAKGTKIKTEEAKEISTFFSTALLKREKPASPITETDLENYIIEAIWKVFDKSRLEIASRSDMSEFDLVLKDARVMGFKIDGYKVLNPEGFTGKTLEVLTMVTITKKGFGVLKSLDFKSGVEEGSLKAYLLSQRLEGKPLIFVEPGNASTTIFAATPKKVSRIGEVGWGRENILKAIRDFFHIDEEADKSAAEKIYKRFINHELSPGILGKLDNIFKSSFRDLMAGIVNISRDTKELLSIDNIFMSISDSLAFPEDLYSRKFLFNDKRAKISKVDDSSYSENLLGFLDEKDRSYKRYNDMAKTRIKWINQSNS